MIRTLVTSCATAGLALACAAPALAQPAAGLNIAGNELLLYDTTAPGKITERHAITGLQSNEAVFGLDVRPATGQLYALGLVRTAQDAGRIYVIDPGTGIATQVGGAPFKSNFTPAEYGFDINPSTGVIRVVNRAEANVRVNATTGELLGNDNNLAPAGDVDAIGYDQNVAGTPQTTLWGYDSGVDKVVRIGGVDDGPPQGSANNGMVVSPFAGGSGVSTGGRAEMDFAPGGAAFLTAATAGPTYSLFSVKLSDGTVTAVGNFPEPVEDIAVLAPSTFQVDGRFLTVNEDAANAVIEVRRSGNVSGTQGVMFSTADGTATGTDYTATSGFLAFGPGEAVKSFTVPITDDAADEQAEKFTVTLSLTTGGAALGTATGTEVTIEDNDVAVVPDTTKPTLLLAVPTTIKSSKVVRGLAGSFSCSEGCTTRFTLKLGKRTLGTAKATLSNAGAKRFKVKLSSKGKKALRKGLKRRRSVRLSLGASGKDAAGNVGKASARVTVTRR